MGHASLLQMPECHQTKCQQQMWQAGPWQLSQGHSQSQIWWVASAGEKENITDDLPMGPL